MLGFDVNGFLRTRAPVWDELERLLVRVDQDGLGKMPLAEARRFGRLYRAVSSDLIRARTENVDASIADYLNDLVARSYAHVYAGASKRRSFVGRFLLHDFPRLFRREWGAVAVSAVILLGGGAIGAAGVALDPSAAGVLIPEQHAEMRPEERVADDEATGGLDDGHEAVAFSSFLFTNNIQVTYLAFALGITFGLGTAWVLFYNGVPLGALAMQYHLAGKGLFFWAWILPHGIPELTVVCIGGGAGLVLARGLWKPGRRTRKDALVAEGKTAVALVLGGMPILIVAGVIEGTISQMHEPTIPYVAKLVFAAVAGTGVYAYLLFAGRGKDPDGRGRV
jgi:uncharacterized membrane protein SpoIIM required for sporulation